MKKNIDRRTFMKMMGIASMAFITPMRSIPSQNKLNVLFIAVDDLRNELGYYDNSVIKTPNIDKLASRGRIFNNHFVPVPTCGASRCSLLTGMRPSEDHHLTNEAIVKELSNKPESEYPETFIHHFRRNGYYTVGMGKISHYPENLIYGYTEQPSEKKELPHSWDEFVSDSGKWKTGWNAFFGYANGENRQSMQRQVKPYECGDVDDDGYPDGLTAKLALSKLNELKNKDKPFFMGVGFFKPHLPFTAPKKYWDMYDPKDIPLSPNPFIPEDVNKASLHNSSELNGYQLTDEKASLAGPVSDAYARKLRHAYYASVSYIDAQVGKLLDELERLDLSKDTIVVLWGDHGWHLGDHLTWGKHTVFERSLKSSLIVKVPGMNQPGFPADGVVESVDIYPSLMELCDVATPNDLDGKSFTNQLNNHEAPGKEAAYGYYRNGISARTDRYRLTIYSREAEPKIELFDHENDPNETKNIAEQNPELVEELIPIWYKGVNDDSILPRNIIDDQNNRYLLYTGTWTSLTTAKSFNKSAVKTKTAGDTVELFFSGTGIKFYTLKGPNLGQFKVYIDGEFKGTVNTSQNSIEFQALAYEIESLEAGETHRINLEVDDLSKDCYVDYFEIIDGVPVLPVLSVSIHDKSEEPTDFELSQNYPNPFNSFTKIQYTLKKPSNVNVDIYNLQGKHIKRLVDEYKQGGKYYTIWNAKGSASGVYYYQIRIDGLLKAKKMIYLK